MDSRNWGNLSHLGKVRAQLSSGSDVFQTGLQDVKDKDSLTYSRFSGPGVMVTQIDTEKLWPVGLPLKNLQNEVSKPQPFGNQLSSFQGSL